MVIETLSIFTGKQTVGCSNSTDQNEKKSILFLPPADYMILLHTTEIVQESTLSDGLMPTSIEVLLYAKFYS